MVYLKIKKCHPNAIIPERSHNDDAGLDLFSIEDITLLPGETVKVRTGICLQVCHQADDFNTYAGFIWDRSSLGSKGIGRLAGLIDQGYTGEIIVCLSNHKSYYSKPNAIQLEAGSKIAQIVFQKVETPQIREVQEFTEETDRGTNGFGSTGR